MHIAEKEILFIYNSQDLQERTAFGYAIASKKYVLKGLDLSKDNLTERQIIEIAQRLRVPLSHLKDGKSNVGSDLTEEDIPTFLAQNPRCLRTPIALYHDRAEFVKSPFHFISQK